MQPSHMGVIFRCPHTLVQVVCVCSFLRACVAGEVEGLTKRQREGKRNESEPPEGFEFPAIRNGDSDGKGV